MKKQIDFRIVSLVFSVLIICFAIAFYVVAWDEPGSAPPTGNAPAPLNVGNDPQIKSGSLRLGGLTVDNDTWLATSAGNVGIGTVSPSEKLDVSGQIHATEDICTDAGGGVCLSTAGGSGVATWDSGWFAISNGGTKLLTHNLGTTAVNVTIYAADDSSGANMAFVGGVNREADSNAKHGGSIQDINTTTFRFYAGYNGYRLFTTVSPYYVTKNWAWARVVASTGGGS